jgi:hypothetical protein
MKQRNKSILLLGLLAGTLVHGQGRKYEGPIDPAGDQSGFRESQMMGNRFNLYFNNQGRLGHWPYIDGSRFPANSEAGLDMFDSNILVVGAKVFVENDSTPITDPAVARAKDPATIDSLFYCLSGHTDWAIDRSPNGVVEWGFEPVFGYFNAASESPAVSTDPMSWPPEGWPSTGTERKWAGLWNGRFGPFPYGDFETYYVMNDAQDQENLQPGNPKYSPRAKSNVKIGDLMPETITQQLGLPWGGVGVRVAVRGYQWNNPQTRDIIFYEYDITNVSDYDLPNVVFGYLMDLGIGHFFGTGDNEDDVGSFNKELDLSFCWDTSGKGYNNYETGTLGFAFLESPGIPNDGIDNDNDGLVDERRDNFAVTKVGATDGITDIAKFLEYNGIASVADLKPHWDADEDQDWRDGEDLNGNGRYDSGERSGDDIGLDGVAPGEIAYTGPDADGTECNHKPDMREGYNAEANFGITDIGESDMLGLSTFHLYVHPQGGAKWVTHDETCYQNLSDGVLDDSYRNPANLNQCFASGPFLLYQGRTERVSMAVIASFENLATMNDQNIAPIQFIRKKVVQVIYESDYRFKRPPVMPTLTATPADGKVVLTWDNRSDRDTREPLLGGENDFEGYRLYKASDRTFQDAVLLRDGFGNPAGMKPLFQCDLKNDYFGFTDFAYVEGEGYFLGNNTGIQHHYEDTEVENGRTYYYCLTAYNRGIKSMDIAPSENVYTITVDESENITFNTPNVAVVTPRPPVNGSLSSSMELLTDLTTLSGTGTVSLNVLEPALLKDGHQYQIRFAVDTLNANPRIPEELSYRTNGFRVYDVTDSSRLIYDENPLHYAGNNILSEAIKPSGTVMTVYYLNNLRPVISDMFDGMQLTLDGLVKEAVWDSMGMGWVQGYVPINVDVNRTRLPSYPWQYDFVFTDENNPYKTRFAPTGKPVIFGTDNASVKAALFFDQSFPFYVENKFFKDSLNGFSKLEVIGIDKDGDKSFDLYKDEMLVGYTYFFAGKERWLVSLFRIDFNGLTAADMPRPGDTYRINFNRPFSPLDTIQFRVLSPEARGLAFVEDLTKVKVVPNPYIVTNTMEPAVRNNALNQRRRLMFINVPAECTIKIFTMSGYLVDTIEVHNGDDNGIAYWDLLTKEDLEIAAGVYVYHLKSQRTNKEKIGKFAVVK